MFSISAINDTDSRQQWEPLAPTKEAQEFHLTQSYHDGLRKLQAREYDKAQELLESVLKDPLISNAQADGNASDGHLLQLRFLALKNLASVFFQQGSAHYENALHCYLQAVEIDTKDSVVWNQLGTLSCSMGLLSISRWAFEQGLLCSPNNWNCMEKLLEVLIAIGDEVACLSVAELILRHWPSHSRALHVKNTIEESEPVPFAPRGIDKLEPKHQKLKFSHKRKAIDKNLDEGLACKKLNPSIELCLPEISWAALANSLLEILHPLNGGTTEMEAEKAFISGDVKLTIHLPSSLDTVMGSLGDSNPERASVGNERDLSSLDEHPHERRSTRLERLRSRKPGKEESEFASAKDLDKGALQFLEPFIVCRHRSKDPGNTGTCSISCPDQTNSLDSEHNGVTTFMRETSKNYGAYHMAHLLLEHAANRGLPFQDAFDKFLELERLTRHWGQDRTPECSLFLAELYYDLGSLPSNASKLSEFTSESSYHLCKIVESVALDYPFQLTWVSGNRSCSSGKDIQDKNKTFAEGSSCQDSIFNTSLLANKHSFWARYFWLSGKLSILDQNKAKALEDFSISWSILAEKEKINDSQYTVWIPHLKIYRELTANRLLQEINSLKIGFLLEKTVGEMTEKEMYRDCIDLLAPLLFSTEHGDLDGLPVATVEKKGEEFTSVELSALNIIIKACEKLKRVDAEALLNSHRRKLQILMVLAGINENEFSCKSGLKARYMLDIESKEKADKYWNYLVADEVKAIARCVSQLKSYMDTSIDSRGTTILIARIGDIQSLLVSVMRHVAINYLYKKSPEQVIVDESEQKQRCCFVDAGIAFCKLQHLVPTVSVKNQVELIVAIHDLLAEYGLCCAGESSEGEEGAFLKFAMKHLLALDMKLKSNLNSSNRGLTECDQQLSPHSQNETSKSDLRSDMLDVEIKSQINEIGISENDASGGALKGVASSAGQGKGSNSEEHGKQLSDEFNKKEKGVGEQSVESPNELTEEEREELESIIDTALDQCFFCLYGLNLRSDSSYEDDLATHKNTSRGDYQTQEQCADVFQYILPYAKASSRTGLIKLRRVLRAIRKHFPQPPEDVLAGNAIDKFLDDPDLSEDKLSEEAGSEGYLDTMLTAIFPNAGGLKHHKTLMVGSSEPYLDVYCDLYYFLALSEEMSASDKWPGFVLTKEGEEFVQQNANLFKYDLLYNPLRFESWQRLANLYDEEVDLLLNDGSKHINVSGWRKNPTLAQRVEISRRRSRRCLLMSLALAKKSAQQCEIRELLALVYYDSLQNVAPFYDQRSVVPSKDAAWMLFCENSLKHFEKAFSHKQDWSHAFYMGKLCEKLGYSYETSLSYYDKAIALNPSAVDPVYRMHASRLKLLFACGKQNLEALKVISGYAFSQSVKDSIMDIFGKLNPEMSHLPEDVTGRSTKENSNEGKCGESVHLEEVWHMLCKDCLSALEICVDGDLKHFHKARYMLAQGLYKRGLSGDLERAKDELSFCFKSSRSSFTINMWEIDGSVKKGRRVAANRKALEVNLPESSRKFITCIRKYLLFYLKLLEETGDISTLDRAFISLRADKRFSLCIEDLVPVALGRFIKALISSMPQGENIDCSASCPSEHKLEKIFSLFMEQGNLWPEVLSLPEIRSAEISESSLYGYLHRYIASLEKNGKLETLEAINEKIRKRFKSPKLSNSNCAKVCRHASVAWCRSLIISLALITPLPSGLRGDNDSSNASLEGSQLLSVDLQVNEIWNSSFEDFNHLENLETKCSSIMTKIQNVVITKVSDENFESAGCLLRSTYNFYRESSCVMLPSGVNLYLVPTRLATGAQVQPGLDGVEILDLSIPRKLLLWSFTLLHGRCANISTVVKHCEENVKPKMKKGAGASSVPSNTSTPTSTGVQTGGCKDGSSHGGGSEAEAAQAAVPVMVMASLSNVENTSTPTPCMKPPESCGESHKSLSANLQLNHCSNTITERSSTGTGHECDGGNLDESYLDSDKQLTINSKSIANHVKSNYFRLPPMRRKNLAKFAEMELAKSSQLQKFFFADFFLSEINFL